MARILFLIERIYHNQFKCNYLRNKDIFVNLSYIFEIETKFQHYEKKISLVYILSISKTIDCKRRYLNV